MDAKLNSLPAITDFEAAYIIAQYAHENGLRAATGKDFYLWITGMLDLLGLSNTAGLPQFMPAPGATLTATDEKQWTFLFPNDDGTAATYNKITSGTITVPGDSIAIAQFDGTDYNTVRFIKMPKTGLADDFGESVDDGATQRLVTALRDRIDEVEGEIPEVSGLLEKGGFEGTAKDLDDKIPEVVNEYGNSAEQAAAQRLVTETRNQANAGMLSIAHKLSDYLIVDENGLYIVDGEGNIAYKFGVEGFDAIALGERLTSIITAIVEEGISTNMPAGLVRTEEDGFYLVDEYGNVGLKFDGAGIFDTIAIGENVSRETYYNETNSALVRQREDLERLKSLESAVDSLISVNTATGPFEVTVTIPNATGETLYNQMVRFGLHYGEQEGDVVFNEVFLNGNCKKNFADVRFVDSDDSVLTHKIVNTGNYDVINSTGLFPIGSWCFQLSDGRLIRSNVGNRISSDYGQTWSTLAISGGIFFIDSSDNIYSESNGIVKKWYASTDYATSNDVLNLNFEEGGETIIGNMVGPYSSCEDNLGYLYFGQYQATWHVALWRSTDGGETFELCYTDENQHIHHVHFNPHDNGIYIGSDNSVSEYGPIAARSLDHGETWEQIPVPIEFRNRDYFPVYFGGGFFIGGGEGDILGGGGLIRSENLSDYENVVPTPLGIRSIVSVDGTDNNIVAGVVCSQRFKTYQLLQSLDKGKTWKAIWTCPTKETTGSGQGGRWFRKVVESGGDEYWVITGRGAEIPSIKLHNGGDRYYGEVYCVIPEIPVGGKQIKVRAGYAMDMPKKVLEDVVTPVYELPLNEGFGELINDSLGRSFYLGSAIGYWEKAPTVRLGELIPAVDGFRENHGLALSSAVNLGKIPTLNFNKNFSVSFWTNQKFGLKINGVYGKRLRLFSIGSLNFYQQNLGFGINYLSGYYRPYPVDIMQFLNSDSYQLVTVTVSNDSQPVITCYINNVKSGDTATATSYPSNDLSEGDFVLGLSQETVNDIHNVFPISRFKVYDRCLTEEEVSKNYYGFNI